MSKGQATKEKILNAATKVFSQYGFEAASIKMILQEADVVTGSFYHFFASKEILFENVIESFLLDYSNRISTIFQNNNLDLSEVIDRFIEELNRAAQTYFEVLEGNKLHWTVQVALHEKTLQSMVVPIADYFSDMKSKGMIKSLINVDDRTLANIIIKGFESIIHSSDVKTGKINLKATLVDFLYKIIEYKNI